MSLMVGFILLIQSIYLLTRTKYIKVIFFILLVVVSITLFFVNSPCKLIDTSQMYWIWQYENLEPYSFTLSGLDFEAPCPSSPTITDTQFNCENGLLKIDVTQDNGFAFALASNGVSIGHAPMTYPVLHGMSPFSSISLHLDEDNCITALPLIAYEDVRIDFSAKVCGDEGDTKGAITSLWEQRAEPLMKGVSFPDGGYISEY